MLYLDSALASDAAAATDLGFVAGVTTNPKLMAAAVEPPVVTLAELCDRGPGVVFYQVTADDELSPREAARIRARERKARPAKMVVDNAGVKRIQLSLRDRSKKKKK